MKLPTGRKVGLKVCSTGMGFWRVTALVAERLLSELLTALMVTEFGVGRVRGALYFPVWSILPMVVFPVATPLTYQVKVWFMLPELPVSWAENCVVSPERSVTLEGVIVMPLEVGSEPEVLKPPPQPDHTTMASPSTTAPTNLAPENFVVAIISDPLS
jgi:hypothetical protein